MDDNLPLDPADVASTIGQYVLSNLALKKEIERLKKLLNDKDQDA